MIHFTFENTHSSKHNLIIAHLGTRGDASTPAFAETQVISDRPANRIAPYIYGNRKAADLRFPLEIFSSKSHAYTLEEVRKIQSWLFARATAHDLTIEDPHRGNRTYNCFLTNPRQVTVGNQVIGWRFTVYCTAPYGLTDEVETIFDLTNNPDSTTIEFNNESDIEDYLHPFMEIETSEGGTIAIENISDNNRIFEITGLSAKNIISIHNDTKIITDTLGDPVFQNFNLNWLRFIRGKNALSVTGKCLIKFKTRFMLAVGGY